MIGLGTLINTAAILVGGLLGFLAGKGIKSSFQRTIEQALGLSTMFLGISGAMEKMLTAASDGTLSSAGSMMFILSMALGAIAGEWINLEGKFEQFGQWLKTISHSEQDTGFIDGFLTTSFTVCIGAMAIIGSIRDGIYGDYTILMAKSVLDFIIVMIMTASKGKGPVFSAIPVFVLQGGMTLLAKLIQPMMTDMALHNLSMVGSALIFCVGVNLVWGKTIKVANLLPAVVFAVIFAFLPVG